jgi:hypothetical protein
VDLTANAGGDDMGQTGFSQSRRAAKQHVVQHVAPLPGRFDPHHEQLHDFLLALEFREDRRAQGDVKG